MKFFSKKRKLFLIGGVFLFIIYLIVAPKLLSFHKNIDTNNYLIEDWVQAAILEHFVSDIYDSLVDKIYIPGRIIEDNSEETIPFFKIENLKERNYVPLLSNSVLVIDPTILYSVGVKNTNSLEIGLWGRDAKDYYPFFSVSINENLVFSGFASDSLKYYKVLQVDRLFSIKSFSITFHNDYCFDSGDRNLYVKSVKVNGEERQLTVSNTVISRTESVYKGYKNAGEFVKDYLVCLGVSPDKIEIIPYEKTKINATWSSAKAVSQYFREISIRGVNVVTSDKHSLRSYIAYRRLIDKNINIGILPVSSNKNIKFKDVLSYPISILDEAISVIVTLIIRD